MKIAVTGTFGSGVCGWFGRLRPLRLFAATALSVLLAPSGLATPLPASVMLTLSGNSWSVGGFIVPTVVEEADGPIVQIEMRSAGQFAGARTDYGVNGSAVSMWGKRPSGAPMTGHTGWTQSTSRWTDQLTIYTPEVALGAPVDFVFSVGLQGYIVGERTDSVSVGGSVRYSMELNEYGSWIDRPSLWHDLWENSGGLYEHYGRIDIDEVQAGRFRVPNGSTFNLISELSTRVSGEYWGPWDTAFTVESSFGNTVSWLGGSVWVGDRQAAVFSVESASGFDYLQPASGVAEPATLTQMALGFAVLGLVLRRARRAARPERTSRPGTPAVPG